MAVKFWHINIAIAIVGLIIAVMLAGCDNAPATEESGPEKATNKPAPSNSPAQQTQAQQQPAKKIAEGWPRFRGPNGNGIVAAKLSLLPEPKRLWRVSVGRGNASLIIQNDRLYTVGQQSGRGYVLSCLQADSGKLIWDKKLESWNADASPVIAKDKLFLLCSQGHPIVHCCAVADGEILWTRKLPKPDSNRSYGHAGSPLLWQDLVIVNAGHGTAVKQSNGEVVWRHDGLAGLATPVLYEHNGKPAVMIFCGRALFGRDARTGRELWSIPWKTDIAVNACDPIFHDGHVFLCTTYGKHAALFDIRQSPPRMVWKTGGSSFSSGFRHKKHLYCFSNNHLMCFDFLSGDRKWRGPSAGGGSVLLAGDKIILVSDRGQLTIAPLSPTEFRPILQATVHGGTTWTPPSLVAGRLYVRDKNGNAMCYQISR